MAGSKKWMLYTLDSGSQAAVQIDESNGEAADFDDYLPASTAPRLPKGTSMRYVNAKEPVSGASRKVYVGKLTSPVWTGVASSLLLALTNNAGLIPALIAFFINSRVGEKNIGVTAADTGLTDGDAS